MIWSRSALVASVLSTLCAASAAYGQTVPEGGTVTQTPASAPARAPGPLLDAPVSRTEYRLGPGDVVEVAVFGDVSFLQSVEISPEGALVIPEIGVTNVLGLNLVQAQARARDLIGRYYRNTEVNLSLSRVRSFKVFVVGDVPGPGVRAASAATRVSEVVPSSAGGIARRTIRLRRASGDSMRVDMARFLQTGDLAANPTLREGDAIVVPTLDRTVSVNGRVAFGGTYEYLPDESLAELLTIANAWGEFPSGAADSVHIARLATAGAGRELIVLSRAEAVGARGRALTLRPFDAVYVPQLSNFAEQPSVTLMGQVLRPGVYPIRPDTTTLREAVAMAGGFTARASLSEGTLNRPSAIRSGAAEANQRAARPTDLQNVPEELLDREERQIRNISTSAQSSIVVVDFETLFTTGAGYDPRLRSGDAVTIPERRAELSVLGAVARPGLVLYTPGLTVEQYLTRAGWLTRRAAHRDIVVIKARYGTRMDPREVRELEPGDQIIVPYRDPIRISRLLQTAQGVVVTITGIVVTVVTAINLNK